MSLKLEELTHRQFTFFVNHIYNGPGSDVFGVKGPEFIFQNEILQHDLDSFGGGTNKDRKVSDRLFLYNCKKRIRETKKYRYYLVAYFYYILLFLFSRFAWDYYDSTPKTWKQFLKRVYYLISQDEQIFIRKVSKKILKRKIKNPEQFKKILI